MGVSVLAFELAYERGKEVRAEQSRVEQRGIYIYMCVFVKGLLLSKADFKSKNRACFRLLKITTLVSNPFFNLSKV